MRFGCLFWIWPLPQVFQSMFSNSDLNMPLPYSFIWSTLAALTNLQGIWKNFWIKQPNLCRGLELIYIFSLWNGLSPFSFISPPNHCSIKSNKEPSEKPMSEIKANGQCDSFFLSPRCQARWKISQKYGPQKFNQVSMRQKDQLIKISKRKLSSRLITSCGKMMPGFFFSILNSPKPTLFLGLWFRSYATPKLHCHPDAQSKERAVILSAAWQNPLQIPFLLFPI